MLIYLVRHAQTKANLGGTEQTVTQEGLKQIAQVNAVLPPVDAVYSSDQDRAIITAEPIARANNTAVQINPDFKEIYACLVGGTTENQDPMRITDDKSRAARVFDFIKKLNHESAVVVCHGNIIRFFMACAAGLPIKNMWRFDVQNCSITTLRITGDVVDILCVNENAHLKNRA